MQTKILKVFSSVLLVAMLALAIGFASQPAAAGSQPAPAAQEVTGITSPDNLAVAAARPWTAAEMRAAKPYPLAKLTSDGGITSDATVGPNGPAGSAPGARPLAAPGAVSEATVDDTALAINPLGYSYPAPFTRFPVANISAYSTYPFRTVGKLFFKQSGLSYVCSASVIANKAIVTAGHCVHKGNNSAAGWSTNVVFVPAYKNGVAPYGQWAVSSLRTFTDWYVNGSSGKFGYDWGAGAITVLKNAKTIGQTVGYLGYAYNFSRVQDWWLLGYPQAAPFNGAFMYACNSSYAYNSPFYGAGPAPMSVGCDQTGGTSGGPWIMRFGYNNYVNSVNSHRATARPLELSGPYADGNTYTVIFAWARAW